MKNIEIKNSRKGLKGTLLAAGGFFFYAALLNTAYADDDCEFVCTDLSTALQECVFVPKGCNNKQKAGIPNQLKPYNPALLKPELIIPKDKFIPVVPKDKLIPVIPKDKLIPGDEFKPALPKK